MKKQFARLFSAALGLIMVVSLFAAPINVNAQIDPLQMLAASTGRNAAVLQLQDSTTATLLNGRQVLRIKALDTKTGEIVGGDFENGIAVDFGALMAEAGLEWRSAHGALTKDTVAYLEKIAPDQRVDISVWLAGKFDELERPVIESRGVPESGTAVNEGEAAAASTEQTEIVDGKRVAIPLSEDQLPEDVLRAIAAENGEEYIPQAVEKTEAEVAAGEAAQFAAIPAADADGQIAAYKAANDQYISSQVMALQEKFAQRLSAAGLVAAYASSNTPLAVLQGVPRSVVEEMARWPEIDAIYIELNEGGPALNNARPAQNGTYINGVGYTGTGVAVSVTEGERAFFANPALTMRNTYDGAQPYQNHPTAVAGFIKSTASGYEGLANGATVDSANGSYSDWSIMSAAMDWGAANNSVLNHSFYWSPGTGTFTAADRQLDYIVRWSYDFAAVASGNFGNGCGGNYTAYVTHPGQGYNVMTVGSYEDVDNTNWADDAMDVCSSFGDPNNDASGTNHEKPEVAAVGATMNSTLTNVSAPLVGPVGSGTSYASPMVAALAADIIQAAPALSSEPEAVKAIIMASALHNIEGAQRLSDVDGAGGVDFSAALTIVERGNFADQQLTPATTFPITQSVYAYKGERVRFVAVWLANPDAAYTTDALPADLDVTAYRSDGTTAIASSASSANGFEIVDFIAPATESYQIKVSKWSYTGGNSWLGTAWFRGEYRIVPEAGYSDPFATPMGTQLAVVPTDWTITNYWRGVGIRSNNSDHDLRMYTEALFGNPSTRTLAASSSYSTATNPIDFVVVDGNHRSSSLAEHYVVKRWDTALPGGYNVIFSNPGIGITKGGTYGAYHLSAAQVLRVYDLYMYKNRTYKITVIPRTTALDVNLINASDLGVRLYKSTSGSPSTYVKGQSSSIRLADGHTSLTRTESFLYTPTQSDWYGLVVYSKTNAVANFYIRVENRVYTPLIRK